MNDYKEYYCFSTNEYNPCMEKREYENEQELVECFNNEVIYDVDFDKFKQKVLKYTEDKINKIKKGE